MATQEQSTMTVAGLASELLIADKESAFEYQNEDAQVYVAVTDEDTDSVAYYSVVGVQDVKDPKGNVIINVQPMGTAPGADVVDLEEVPVDQQ